MDIDPLYYHWQMQWLIMREVPLQNQLSPAGPLDNAEVPTTNNIASSSQVPPNTILTHLRPMSTTIQEIEEALEIIQKRRTKIIVSKNIKVMVFNDKYTKKFILTCPK